MPKALVTRRELLTKLSYLLAASGSLTNVSDALAKLNSGNAAGDDKIIKVISAGGSYQISDWTGDDFTLGHRLRDRDFPKFPANVSAKVDFVIVGGGIAGLCAAHYLKNHHYLLLEQSAQLGGQARGGSSITGMNFSYGSQMLASVNGAVGELLHDLNLHPTSLTSASSSWLWDNTWVKGIAGQDASAVHNQFSRLIGDSQSIWSKFSNQDLIAPISDQELLSLDRKPFCDLLTGYTKPFSQLLDSYLKSYYCAGTGMVSALSALAALKNLTTPNYLLPGGNADLSIGLTKAIAVDRQSPRCLTNAFVWSIELGDDGNYVTYSTIHGECHKVECRHVILCSPHMVSLRLLSNLNSASKMSLYGYRYGSYLVANLLLKNKVLDANYAHFAPPPYSFSKLAWAPNPSHAAHKSSAGCLLTVLQPYEPASPGRALLLAGNREAFAASIIKELAPLTDGLLKNLEQIILSRWGHAMAVPSVGYFAKLNKLCESVSPNYSLAHSSARGLPRIESAVAAAKSASNRALGIKEKAQTLHFGPTGT
jgi:protoporphyrinogen oxidase